MGHDDDAVISMTGMRKAYGSIVALRDVSFEIRRGEIFGILGPNGAGKTTAVEILQGLRHADAGEIRILGLDPALEPAALKRRIGSQLQESGLPDRIRVDEALGIFAAAGGGGTDVETLMADWGLTDKRRSAFASLSGGQKQRLFVALALVRSPEIVFLDEMTTGMDPAARRVAWELIERLRERGTTVVLVTHFMDEAERLCDRVVAFRAGAVVAEGTPSQLRATYGRAPRMSFTSSRRGMRFLAQVDGVSRVSDDGGRTVVECEPAATVRVAAALSAHGIEPIDLSITRDSLEDVYLRLVGEDPFRQEDGA